MDGEGEVRRSVEGAKVRELIREMRAEHRDLVGQLVLLEAAAAAGGPVPDGAGEALAGAGAHMDREEKELYPALEPFVGTGTVTMTLLAEHAALRDALGSLCKGGMSGRWNAPEAGRRLRDHIVREEKMLFDLAERLLPGEGKTGGDEGSGPSGPVADLRRVGQPGPVGEGGVRPGEPRRRQPGGGIR